MSSLSDSVDLIPVREAVGRHHGSVRRQGQARWSHWRRGERIFMS